MRIRLNKIKLENFKCFKEKTIDFQGRNTEIRAENKKGKTTIKDAINWLLFGRLSDGRSTGYRPVVTDPGSPDYMKPVKGLVVMVEAELLLGNVMRTLRKEEYEVVAKNQDVKYTSNYRIDGVPQDTQRDYKNFIDNIIPVDKFKMQIDLEYFNDDKKNPWEQRRKTLRDMAGLVSEPQGEWQDGFRAKLNGKTVKEYEKELKGRIKKYEEEQSEIPILLNEKHKDLAKYEQIDSTEDIEQQRDECKENVVEFEAKRAVLRNSEAERAGRAEHLNRLAAKRSHRETVLKNQTGPVDVLRDEKSGLLGDHASECVNLTELQSLIRQAETAMVSSKNTIEASLLTLKSIKSEYAKANSPNCSKCNQPWPDGMLKPGIADIEARGNQVKKAIEDCKAEQENQQAELNAMAEKETEMKADIDRSDAAMQIRIIEIDKAIKNRPEPDPTADVEWKNLTAEIEAVKGRLGEPLIVQIDSVNEKIRIANDLLEKLNTCLNHADVIKDTKARIAELEARQPKIGQDIAKTEGLLDEVKLYNAAQNRLIEGVVNDLFEHVTYKLFYYHQNGEYESCCVAIHDGVSYPSMSDGQKIYCNIDVRNTLSDHYGVEVFLFLDHVESLTLPIEAESQVIKLYAQEGVKELAITFEEKAVK